MTACSSLPPLDIDPQLPRQAEVKDLAFYPQKSDQCGPESLATLLSHSGINVHPTTLSPTVYLPNRNGSLAIELIAQTRQQQRIAYPIEPNTNHLLSMVAGGFPVLVMQNLGFSWRPQWHFAVVIGYDLDTQSMILRSGPTPRYTIPLSLFLKTWKRANYWGMTALSPENLPANLKADTFIQASSDLEQTQQTKTAKLAYQAATQRWPDNPIAWFGLGNTAYRLNQFNQAIDSYLRAAKETSELTTKSTILNNLAFAYKDMGCHIAAKKTIGLARKLAPQDKNILDSERTLFRLSDNSLTQCEPYQNKSITSN